MLPVHKVRLLIPAATFLLVIQQLHHVSSSSNQDDDSAELCSDCRLASQSIESLVSRPRQMDSYGQVSDRIDLDKIKKTICRDIVEDKSRERCRSFYFGHQSSVLKWKQTNARVSFFDSVCIKELKLCCPAESFGPKCAKCKKCKPNEHCDGEGTRQGSGNCTCRLGHTGANCATCEPGYYLDGKVRSPSIERNHHNSRKNELAGGSCKPCHRSCLYCRYEGSLGCEVCRQGFKWLPEFGCSDIDECTSQAKICGENTFCVNTEGSYFCYECDRACDGCHGDGPDMCLRCAKGYKSERGNCVATKKTILPPEVNYYRYGIYLGLCICTCIILHNSVYLAGFIGLSVALYIGVSEYIMSGHQAAMEQHSVGQRLQANQLFGGDNSNGQISLAHLGL